MPPATDDNAAAVTLPPPPSKVPGAAALIVVLGLLAYANALDAPFIFDDYTDIVRNPAIHRLWPLHEVCLVQAKGRTGMHPRPVVALTFAVNYACAKLEPWPYHATNVAIHLLAGLVLLGIVRRTLLLPALKDRFGPVALPLAGKRGQPPFAGTARRVLRTNGDCPLFPALPLALAVALIWTVHPVLTQAVTGIVQRYESLMGLFYLLALYATIRCGTSARPVGWGTLAVIAGLLALGSKEVAVSLPIVILLYDRTLLAGSFGEALRRRWGLYLGLAADWAAFAALQWFVLPRTTWAGYQMPVRWYEYLRSQPSAILHYLRLAFWPQGLCLDYGWPVARTAGAIVPGAIVVGLLLLATAYLLWRRSAWGLLGAWFFLILAPTSSVLPLINITDDYRMYLPLAAVVVAVVLGGYLVGSALLRRWEVADVWQEKIAVFAVTALVLPLAIATGMRNHVYRTDLSLYGDMVQKRPSNARAHYNLGVALAVRKRFDEAVEEYEKALTIRPQQADAHNNLGVILADRGRTSDAIAHFRQAIALDATFSEPYNNLGNALLRQGQWNAAVAQYRKALSLEPSYAEAHYNLGVAYARFGLWDEAAAEYRRACQLDPAYARPPHNLGEILRQPKM